MPAVAVGSGFTVSITSSVAVPQAGLSVLVVVRRRVTVPVPLTDTPVLSWLTLLIEAVAPPVELRTDHLPVPFVAVPLSVKAVAVPVTHLASSVPALANGSGFTVSITSSVAVPQAGLSVLVVVRRRVTVPVPLTDTPVLSWLTLLIEAVAPPVELRTDHLPVPFVAVPLSVKAVAVPVTHLASSVPALANGSGFTVRTVVLVAVPQAGFVLLFAVSVTLTVPVPVTRTSGAMVLAPDTIVAVAPPVVVPMLQVGVPLVMLPLDSVKVVVLLAPTHCAA
ncbi:hypothetical protein GCM10007389_28590 [Pontibacter akesuensis]|nr:hypothetical protein GCM10007389_28590 [Pontibacter akesuensis]